MSCCRVIFVDVSAITPPWLSIRIVLLESMLSEFGTSVKVVSGRIDSKLVGFGVLSSWL